MAERGTLIFSTRFMFQFLLLKFAFALNVPSKAMSHRPGLQTCLFPVSEITRGALAFAKPKNKEVVKLKYSITNA